MTGSKELLSPGLCGQLACLLEVSAPKAGNVHRGREFADTTFLDFVVSAAAIGPALDGAGERSIGETILDAVRRTRGVTRSNTNLGIVLLLAPLARVFRETDLPAALETALCATTLEDAELAYEAIRIARPGGLGTAVEEDVSSRPTRRLRDVMALAADRDRIARQYATAYADVFEHGVGALEAARDRRLDLETSVGFCHLHWLATFPDSLIARKCGGATAAQASGLARDVLDAGWPHTGRSRQRFDALDRWLRADGNRRNPGTSADLTTASLFLAIRDGIIGLPLGCRQE